MRSITLDKSIAFEYFLLKSFEHSRHTPELNDFSILKTQKLLFLLTAVNADSGSQYLLNNVFDNFVAMPYGPVEIDVYDDTKNGRLKFMTINSSCLSCVPDTDFSLLRTDIKNEIDSSINELLKKNKIIFNLRANELVEITHMYSSWKQKYFEARKKNSLKEPIPKELIISDSKFYSLNPFELI